MKHRLRIYTGEPASPEPERQVTVQFGEVLSALVHALRCNRTWLRDFNDDEITVSRDLYDVISAYTHLRPSA